MCSLRGTPHCDRRRAVGDHHLFRPPASTSSNARLARIPKLLSVVPCPLWRWRAQLQRPSARATPFNGVPWGLITSPLLGAVASDRSRAASLLQRSAVSRSAALACGCVACCGTSARRSCTSATAEASPDSDQRRCTDTRLFVHVVPLGSARPGRRRLRHDDPACATPVSKASPMATHDEN